MNHFLDPDSLWSYFLDYVSKSKFKYMDHCTASDLMDPTLYKEQYFIWAIFSLEEVFKFKIYGLIVAF